MISMTRSWACTSRFYRPPSLWRLSRLIATDCDMSGLAVFASPGRYVQGRDATSQLGQQLKAAGLQSPVLLLADPVVIPMLQDKWQETFAASGHSYQVVAFGGECTAEETDSLVAKAREAGAKTIVGCGGGKVLDTARAAADLLEVPVVNAPTAASTDSPCTALSVLYTATGDFDSYRFYKSHPRLVLVDTAVVARAPKRLLVSGMGDALGTWFEARTTYEAFGVNLLSGACTQAGLALARCCYETLIRDGEEALAAVDEKVVTPALERVIEANTLLSGLGAESGGLAVAHALHNGMTQAPGSHKFLHGEKVAFGTVTQLVLEGRPRQELDEVFSFCCKVGLPVTLAQVGLDAADAATLLAVARAACAEGETCHNEPFKMVPEALRDAMLAADKLGRRYLDRVPPLT